MFTQLTARYDHFYDRKDYAGEASEGRPCEGGPDAASSDDTSLAVQAPSQ